MKEKNSLYLSTRLKDFADGFLEEAEKNKDDNAAGAALMFLALSVTAKALETTARDMYAALPADKADEFTEDLKELGVLDD